MAIYRISLVAVMVVILTAMAMTEDARPAKDRVLNPDSCEVQLALYHQEAAECQASWAIIQQMMIDEINRLNFELNACENGPPVIRINKIRQKRKFNNGETNEKDNAGD